MAQVIVRNLDKQVVSSLKIKAGLRNQGSGSRLDFLDDPFAAAVSAGVLTVGHAPPDSLHELIRITRRGGHLILIS